jgi:hypothetical protein
MVALNLYFMNKASIIKEKLRIQNINFRKYSIIKIRQLVTVCDRILLIRKQDSY